MQEEIFKSNIYQIIIPMDTSIEKVIDTNKFKVSEFRDYLILIEKVEEKNVDKNT